LSFPRASETRQESLPRAKPRGICANTFFRPRTISSFLLGYFVPKDMEGNLEFGPERRRCLRQQLHAPVFASFDGVSGGMILDLSEEGLAMQTDTRLEREQRVRLELDLGEPAVRVETTGYIAWADALGRAGVRFSELPEDARRRLNEWLTVNAGAPSTIAPKVEVGKMQSWPVESKSAESRLALKSGASNDKSMEHAFVSLEAEKEGGGNGGTSNGNREAASGTVQYEFNSLGTDLTAALRTIGERARTLTRGTSAAIALVHKGGVMCRASVGESAPALGARLDVNSGLSGECFRRGKALRCDDAEHDPRVDLESCRRLGVRSIVVAPVRYERDTVGLLMVFAKDPFNFDEGDVAVVESLAHTVVRSMRQADAG